MRAGDSGPDGVSRRGDSGGSATNVDAAPPPLRLADRLCAGTVRPDSEEARRECREGASIGDLVRRRFAEGCEGGATRDGHGKSCAHRADATPPEGKAQDSRRARARAERREREARREVAKENVLASALPPTDVRWILALRVQGELQGGRAALLTPTVRERLMAEAAGMGLRAFDASLVIAIVQDEARMAAAGMLRERLRLVRPAGRAGVRGVAAAAGLAVGLGMLAVVMLARWVAAG